MIKTGGKLKKIQLNKVCRSCLSERGHLREIFSTRIPMLMESCASVQVNENDGLPKHICVSCFHQIAKFYNFKRKMEKSDRVLRNYIKQNKTKIFSDILHRAVNDAEIGLTCEDLNNGSSDNLHCDMSEGEDDIPLSQRQAVRDPKKAVLKSSKTQCDILKTIEGGNFDVTFPEDDLEKKQVCDVDDLKQDCDSKLVQYYIGGDHQTEREVVKRCNRKAKQKTNKLNIIKVENEEDVDDIDVHSSSEIIHSEQQKNDVEVIQVAHLDKLTPILPQIFTDGPPPLVPLAKTATKPDPPLASTTLKSLPENTPPLVPIKPLAAIDPATIVNTFAKTVDEDLGLKMICNICEEEFSSVIALKEHRLTNCQSSRLQCNICKKEFKERKRLIGHLKGHMVVKDYGCKICGKCYPNPSTFRVHMRTHTGERPFKCHLCNKGFVRWAGVVGHMKTHNSVKPYKCETCGKGFKITSNLERHKVLHTGILPFCCNFCGKTFSQSDNLQLHIRTYHTHEKPYLCNVCGKGFVSSTRLNRHMWVHTGYKPYACKLCSKAYSNSNDLKNHERSHSGNVSDADKPHACPVCNMRFFHQCRLTKHMKTHERGFVCTECNKSYSTVELFNKHMANKHGQTFTDQVMSVPLNQVYFTIE